MKTCDRCRRQMADGSLAFEVRIQVRADFDGVLQPVEPEALPGLQAQVLAAMDAADPADLMHDVHHEERHLLCPRCRERFLANPLNQPLPDVP